MDSPQTRAGHRGIPGEVVLAGRRGLRYRAWMKRIPPKLAVRRETIRALATLELSRAIGGDAPLVEETFTCKEACTSRAAVKPPAGG